VSNETYLASLIYCICDVFADTFTVTAIHFHSLPFLHVSNRTDFATRDFYRLIARPLITHRYFAYQHNGRVNGGIVRFDIQLTSPMMDQSSPLYSNVLKRLHNYRWSSYRN